MNARTTRSTRSRLARLEAAVAKLPRSPRSLPAGQAFFFRYLCETYAEPATIIPSARALLAALADCCAVFPEDGDADLTEPALAGRLSALRQELLAFLDAHLDTDHRRWRYSTAWTELALAGYLTPGGARERGPTAQQWCDSLSDLEVVFEAVDCLVTAESRVRKYRDARHWRCPALLERCRLSAEEEAVLVAELDAEPPEHWRRGPGAQTQFEGAGLGPAAHSRPTGPKRCTTLASGPRSGAGWRQDRGAFRQGGRSLCP